MKNFLIVLALVIFGWEASVPLMYFAAQGHLSFIFIFSAGIFGSLVSDSFWYIIGRRITHERISRVKYFRNRPKHYTAISRAIRKRGYLFLFCSKFLYGMGVPAHILSGAYRLSYPKSFVVNALGSMVWLSFVFGLARGAQEIPNLRESLVVSQIVFGAFVLAMFGVHFVVGKIMKKFFNLDSENAGESDAERDGDIQ